MADNPSNSVVGGPFNGTTDVIFQSFRLYIEGVQVPFTNISINSDGSMPSASISVPPLAGLEVISHSYKPKVHIFYLDLFSKRWCVLFQGFIISVSYFKTRNLQGSSGINFECTHKLKYLDEVTLSYINYADGSTDPKMNQSIAETGQFSSEESFIEALVGITTRGSESPEEVVSRFSKNAQSSTTVGNMKPDVLDTRWEKSFERFKGFAGVIPNLWNQMNRPSEVAVSRHEIMCSLYKPLVEEGLDFFNRITGHYEIESKIQDDRSTACSDSSNSYKVMTPPYSKLFIMEAVQSTIAVEAMSNMGQFSNEYTSYLQMLRRFYQNIEYDFLILTSPAQASQKPSEGGADRYPADAIVKPQLPLYYTPACNVIYPSMLVTLNFSKEDISAPSRITARSSSNPAPGSGGDILSLNFRAPNSVRESYERQQVSAGQTGASEKVSPNLQSMLGLTLEAVGRYEQGIGVRPKTIHLPYWMTLLSAKSDGQGKVTGEEAKDVDLQGSSLGDVTILRKAWASKYYLEYNDINSTYTYRNKSHLNPYSPDCKLAPYQRVLQAMADYKFTLDNYATRGGSITTLFNPYIVAGYPIDIINGEPTDPSFHANAIGVTHSITPSSCSTTINFAAAASYTELANYHVPYVYPWLQAALSMIKKVKVREDLFPPEAYNDPDIETGYIYSNSIIGNSEAKVHADSFYNSVFGVGAVSPDQVYDFGTGKVKDPITGASYSDRLKSGYGSLSLAYREIESKDFIEKTYGLSFIDMDPALYNYVSQKYRPSTSIEPSLLEPGASMFLEYAKIMGERSKFEQDNLGKATAYGAGLQGNAETVIKEN